MKPPKVEPNKRKMKRDRPTRAAQKQTCEAEMRRAPSHQAQPRPSNGQTKQAPPTGSLQGSRTAAPTREQRPGTERGRTDHQGQAFSQQRIVRPSETLIEKISAGARTPTHERKLINNQRDAGKPMPQTAQETNRANRGA